MLNDPKRSWEHELLDYYSQLDLKLAPRGEQDVRLNLDANASEIQNFGVGRRRHTHLHWVALQRGQRS